ncbi:MAG: glycosyltransferase [Candidatus Competibacteraceae bacterium]|nr:glycosyltransferase [Candidatus Competibacteraceae bacterium]
MTKVCVVIVTYNGSPWIRKNLESLRRSSILPHVIVVDNASTDNTAEIIESEFADIDLIKLQKNYGFGVGNNFGISKAIALHMEFTFLLNQDAYVTETTIEEMTTFLEQHQEFGIVSPLHCSPNLKAVDRKTFYNYLQRYAYQYLSDAALGQIADYYPIRGINAAAWFSRTSVFQKVGGFDPIFFMYAEDDDLINRFELHRVTFALLPKSRFVHLRETSALSSSLSFWQQIKRRSERIRSSLILEIKDPSFSFSHMILQLVSKGMIIPFANFLIERDLRELLSTWIATLRVILEIRRIKRHANLSVIPRVHFL